MSIAAGLSLMKKLGAKIASISVKGLPESSIKSALKSEASSVSIYAVKIDSGEKKGWCVKQPIVGGNPLIVNPNYPSDSDKKYKGCFDTLQRLQNKYSPSELKNDDYAFVLAEVPCMHDTVSGAFLKNKGTGNFNLGQVISSSDDYVILDYLESTGTQYIDTNIQFQANDKIEIEITPIVRENSVICGAQEDNNKICTLGINSSSINGAFVGNLLESQTPIYNIGTKYPITNQSGQWKVGITNFGRVVNNNINYTNTLFAKNGQQVENYSRCRIHSYKHIRNGQTIMNLRPVNRLADLIKWKWNASSSTWVKDGEVLEEAVTFNSQADAQSYITNNNLKYTYPNGTVSTISPLIIEGYNPKSSGKVDEMADQLGPDCKTKNDQCWNGPPTPTGRPGTPIEFTQVIKQKIFSFG